jgi:transcriptional regulator with XRE-family HTH domain
MTIGEHITTLRKRKNLSQADLGKLIGTSGDIVGRYERDLMTPSIDVIMKISDALEVSIDFLVGKSSIELDKKMLARIQDIQHLDEQQQQYVFALLDAFLRDHKAKKAYAS